MKESPCYKCEFYDSEFDELTNNSDEWCEKGHNGIKGFPFKNQPKCFKKASWIED